MKHLKNLLILIAVSLLTLSCKEECVTNDDPRCEVKTLPPELCAAYFERWFYNKESNTCSKIGYSGCSQYGFETKENCEKCKCNE